MNNSTSISGLVEVCSRSYNSRFVRDSVKERSITKGCETFIGENQLRPLQNTK